MINKKLTDLYNSKLPRLQAMYSDLDSKSIKNYAGPLLIHCFESEYAASKYKLMIIGQETNDWFAEKINGTEKLNDSLRTYEIFRLGEGYESKPFWRTANYINEKLNGGKKLNFIWNNVNKFGLSGIGRPDAVVLDNENKYFNLLSDELRILKPDACVFLSGPDYDTDIKNKLPDIKFLPFSSEPERAVARLKSRSLPEHSYRTYHPGYGLRNPNWYYAVLDVIIADIKK